MAALAATQTVGYGVLYYAYAVFLTPIATALHTSTTVVADALTCSVLAPAPTAAPVGRWLDRHGGRGLMTGGSLAATLLVLAWSQVHSIAALYLVWTGIGLASACVLYEAAFAVIITWFRRQRANALLALTVVAGFASSIFLPLTGHLIDRYGWRGAIVVLAIIHALVTVPGHLLVRRPPHGATPRRVPDRADDERHRIVSSALHDPSYWALTVAFLASAAAIAVIAVHLVAYLTELGHAPNFAATVAGLLGVLSVTGRLATTSTTRRLTPVTVTSLVFLLQALSAASLPLVGRKPWGAIACVVGFGLGFGVATIARPAILADRYGTTAYATISGILGVPLTIAKALAPLVAAAGRDATGTYTDDAIGVAILCVLAAGALLAIRSRRSPDTRTDRGGLPVTADLSIGQDPGQNAGRQREADQAGRNGQNHRPGKRWCDHRHRGEQPTVQSDHADTGDRRDLGSAVAGRSDGYDRKTGDHSQ